MKLDPNLLACLLHVIKQLVFKVSKGRDARVVQTSTLAALSTLQLLHLASATSWLSLSVAGATLDFPLCHHVGALLKTLLKGRRKRREKGRCTSQGVGKSLTRKERKAAVRSHCEPVFDPW